MAKGVVILPMLYQNEELIPAGYPMLNAYNHQIHLVPDRQHCRQIIIKEQDYYLKFRPQKNTNSSIGIKIGFRLESR